jgi:hypothetical protein
MNGTSRQHPDRACFSRFSVVADTPETRRDDALNEESDASVREPPFFHSNPRRLKSPLYGAK